MKTVEGNLLCFLRTYSHKCIFWTERPNKYNNPSNFFNESTSTTWIEMAREGECVDILNWRKIHNNIRNIHFIALQLFPFYWYICMYLLAFYIFIVEKTPITYLTLGMSRKNVKLMAKQVCYMICVTENMHLGAINVTTLQLINRYWHLWIIFRMTIIRFHKRNFLFLTNKFWCNPAISIIPFPFSWIIK